MELLDIEVLRLMAVTYPEKIRFFHEKHPLLGTFALLTIGQALYIFYFISTSYRRYAMDIDGHIYYIQYIASHLSLPTPFECWECYQPPLYYIISAIAYRIGQSIGLAEPFTAVRFVSMIFYNVFLYFGIRLLRETIRTCLAYHIAVALLIFWPLSIIKVSQISNDIPLYMAEMASFYCLTRWWKHLRPQSLAFAILWNAVAICFKNSGVIVSGVIACVILYGWRRHRFSWRTTRHRVIIKAAVLSLLLVGASSGRVYYYYRIAEHRAEPLMVPNAEHYDKQQELRNEWRYFITFDLRTYLTMPFYSLVDDSSGRQYFWNSVLKSSLFSEFTWKSPELALIMAQLELAMLCYLLASWSQIALQDRQCVFAYAPFFLFVSTQLAALLTYRVLYPSASDQDYRFIYPITPVMAVLYTKPIEWHQERHSVKMMWLGVGIGILFVMLSILFYMLQRW